ncbi:MAG TPA: menaquinone biosynthesis protein [Thermodesulfovibrio thiophilus]|uniref:menaquinone biosynthetic enzyme MqnA/MqnD family protein n=1 Tax=Thermodesulfovibrio thiophilus TaxID=340095 RepID=UPI0018114DE5|nr:menaquinone biosynthesis protein [Thermodesulfovibrio thiophilus]HHW20264.1 menaquinone biosynthesis protein [Thermodesulfovibrio thiophilus]HOA82967.1 menaquinone biosynthesis protein [Thermodesulfovibrio thiophilus]HQD36042.1 menaquinone biosynthesis protein [Thermodesulfovibrio thiophilus]
MKLKVGWIQYANVYPIFYVLEREKLLTDDIHLVKGVPSQLNWALRNSLIDVSPSSSVEYLLNQEIYDYVDEICISAKEYVASVLFFSNYDIKALDGRKILLTEQSATSHLLLKVILEQFVQVKPEYDISAAPYTGESFLLIGDDALKYSKLNKTKKVYDLANLWYQYTGLPFVFALWIVRKEVTRPDCEVYREYLKFREKLLHAKNSYSKYFNEMVKDYYLTEFMTKDEIVYYWTENMDYNLTDKHKESLKLFEKYINSLA